VSLPSIVVVSTGKAPKDGGRACRDSVRVQVARPAIVHCTYDAGTGRTTVIRWILGGILDAAADEMWIDRGMVGNLAHFVRDIDPQSMVAWVDLDDALAGPEVLESARRLHERGAWVTYGSFTMPMPSVHPGCPPGLWRRTCLPYLASPRSEPWQASHLKTFLAGVIQELDVRGELTDPETGRYWDLACDQSVMIPAIELAGLDRTVAVPEVRYLYSGENWRLTATPEDIAREAAVCARIRDRRPLERLASAPWGEVVANSGESR
jgi:hypothetical protein